MKNFKLEDDLDAMAAVLGEKEEKVMELEETIFQVSKKPLSPAAESKLFIP